MVFRTLKIEQNLFWNTSKYAYFHSGIMNRMWSSRGLKTVVRGLSGLL